MNERRFVVEIARPVPEENLETAAAYVAQRLGIDVARIRTLLAGRTGAVSRELAVEKAEAIARVFGEAGVMVTVVERAADAAELGEQQSQGAAADHDEPGVDFEYDGPPAHGADSETPPWVEDDDPRGSNRGSAPEAVVPDYRNGERPDEAEPDTIDLRPSSTRWVPSPHEASAETYRESHDYRREPLDEPDDDRDATASSLFYDDRAEVDDEQLAAIFAEASPKPQTPEVGRPTATTADDTAQEPDDFGGDEVIGRRGPWLAPERSPFGDYEAAPHDRLQLRRYLLWGLVLSIVLLIALQLVFTLAGRAGAGAADYDDGLAPYRSGDFVAARGIWEDAAGKGDARAQYMLGYLVQNGLGQPWSNRQAAAWYDQAAAQGLPEAQTALAQLYLEGLGVQPDSERGLELLRSAAAAGDSAAQYQYGELLFHGRWVTQDFGAALEAFERAAAGGSLEAADFVGLARYLGFGAAE